RQSFPAPSVLKLLLFRQSFPAPSVLMLRLYDPPQLTPDGAQTPAVPAVVPLPRGRGQCMAISDWPKGRRSSTGGA
ncbi:hypothetical protein, partial [Methanoculleus sediminis]|uniref:hypothetical protein n=1 Tax=Methanoculleus sediminis TaxID=1550566 RepID=UPI0019D3FFBD